MLFLFHTNRDWSRQRYEKQKTPTKIVGAFGAFSEHSEAFSEYLESFSEPQRLFLVQFFHKSLPQFHHLLMRPLTAPTVGHPIELTARHRLLDGIEVALIGHFYGKRPLVYVPHKLAEAFFIAFDLTHPIDYRPRRAGKPKPVACRLLYSPDHGFRDRMLRILDGCITRRLEPLVGRKVLGVHAVNALSPRSCNS